MRTIFVFMICGLFAVQAFAADDISRDKAYAVSNITSELRNQCFSDYFKKARSSVEIAGDISFSDRLTEQVYTTLYWNNAQRGVAFLLPVKGKRNEKIACYYALQPAGLAFQMSQNLGAAPMILASKD